MKSVSICLSLCVLTVAGCGGSNSGPAVVIPTPTPVGPAEVSMGTVPSMVTLDYDDVTDVLTVAEGATTDAMMSDASLDAPGFAGYSGTNSFANAGETSSGAGRAAVVSSETSAFGIAGTFYERVGDTLVPISGTATYSGNYVGYLADEATLNPIILIGGDAELSVDFADETVDGMITGRTTVAGISIVDFENMTLEEGSIVDGAFSGTTAGGTVVTAGATVAAGEYEGVLTGASAEEAVGGVQVMHDISGTAYVETGAFIVEE